MEDGNEANVVSGITQFAKGETGHWKYNSTLISSTVDNLKRQESSTTASAVEYFFPWVSTHGTRNKQKKYLFPRIPFPEDAVGIALDFRVLVGSIETR